MTDRNTRSRAADDGPYRSEEPADWYVLHGRIKTQKAVAKGIREKGP